ncbi:MAG: TonB C-terminal domain-containing protein, partial [Desulfovibrionaceae bacterium]|nr:TonB C-terminal domain-containing protein [Desulfovibrionaceae bacterium]
EPEKPKEEKPKEEKPKEEPKPKEKPKEQPKPEVKPKEEPEPEAKPKEQPKPQEKPKEKPRKPKDSGKGVGGEKGLEDVISAMQAEVSSRDKTGGGSGRGQGQGHGNAVGIQASYVETVKAIIQREWTYAGRADRAQLQAVVRLELDPNGKITGYTFLRRSGDPTFDSTLETALSRAANKLTPPPNPSLQKLEITFYDQ